MKKILYLLILFTCFFLGALEYAPSRVVRQTPYPFTPDSLQLSRDVTIDLRIVVNADGSTGHISTTNSYPPLDSLAISYARLWEYVPATKDSVGISSMLRLKINFSARPLIEDKSDSLQVVAETGLDSLSIDVTTVTKDSLCPLDLTTAKEKMMTFHNNWRCDKKHAYIDNQPYLDYNAGAFSAQSQYNVFYRAYHLLPSIHKPLALALSLARFTHQDTRPHLISLAVPTYDVPILYTYTESGMGGSLNKYAQVNLFTADPLNIPHSFLQGGVYGEKVVFNETRQFSGDFYLHGVKKTFLGDFGTGYTRVNHQLSAAQLAPEIIHHPRAYHTQDILINDVFWQNKFLDIIYYHSNEKYKNRLDQERKTDALRLSREFSFLKQNIRIAYQQSSLNDFDNIHKQFTTAEIYYKGGYRRWQLKASYLSSDPDYLPTDSRFDNQYIITRYRLPWQLLIGFEHAYNYRDSFLISYPHYKKEKCQNIQIGWQAEQSGTSEHFIISMGKKSLYDSAWHHYKYAQIKSNFGVRLDSLLVMLDANYTYHYVDKQSHVAKYDGAVGITARWQLAHHNAIILGAVLHHYDDYLLLDNELEQADIIDTFLALELTQLFQIKAHLKNLNNQKYYAGYRIQPRHLSINISWSFFN